HETCVADALRMAEDICAARDVRFTEIRRKVLELVWESHEPVKAYDLLEKLDQHFGAVKPPTVYRALDFLTEHGLVHKINSLNAFVGCSHPLRHAECYFLICADCGEAEECCNADIVAAIERTTAARDFRAKQITLEISGRCRHCRKVN